MARKSSVDTAKAALARLKKEREEAAERLAKVDAEIAELCAMFGMTAPPKPVQSVPMPAPIPEPTLEVPDNLAPQDDMGPGRLI